MQINFGAPREKTSFRFDRSALTLLGSNVFVIALALWEKWDVRPVMWIYWGQSIAIGAACFLRMWNLKDFTVKHLKVNGKTVEASRAMQRRVSFFFLVHYGMFHLVYFVFMSAMWAPPRDTIGWILLGVVLFWLDQFVSLWRNWEEEVRPGQHIGEVMQSPYPRIIPMHLTIIFGSFLIQGIGTLLLFLSLKTVADMSMQMRGRSVI